MLGTLCFIPLDDKNNSLAQTIFHLVASVRSFIEIYKILASSDTLARVEIFST